ncbi:hypothetical protein SAMN05421799_10764 [Alicyclobacillus vulcanalis]|uniref:Uncharacterized protein n=1 Tax=Alicyclobacillus vulcanalis TaxID=252246 RepID=A0A1N7N4I6_9BACL|nr:hypothetical protein SAMN05421799_10764 [Alicyclobacillus vulcanalis]
MTHALRAVRPRDTSAPLLRRSAPLRRRNAFLCHPNHKARGLRDTRAFLIEVALKTA